MPTVAEINSAIETTLGAASGIVRSQDYDKLTEGIHGADMPLLQVYPESGNTDSGGGNTDRTTFGAGRRQTTITFHADLYARQRSHISEDMAAVVAGMDSIIAILEAQKERPFFGLGSAEDKYIKSFRWRWERVVFQYGDQSLPYAGVRFIIEATIF